MPKPPRLTGETSLSLVTFALRDCQHQLHAIFSESGQQCGPDSSDATITSRHSPRSTLESVPGLSPPHSARKTN